VSKIIHDPKQVIDYLADFDLHPAKIQDALQRAMSARLATPKSQPRTASGLNFFNHFVGGVRQQYCSMGWQQMDEENFSTMVSPTHPLQIAFARGTSGTGICDGNIPTTRSRRGPHFKKAVDNNSLLPGLFPPPIEYKVNGLLTYVLLYNYDAKFIFSELSKPVSYCDKDERPDGWDHRVIIEPIPLENFADTCKDNTQKDFDVSVEPK